MQRVVAVSALLVCLNAGAASPASLFHFRETIGGVFGTLSGTLDVAGAIDEGTEVSLSDGTGMAPEFANIATTDQPLQAYVIFGPSALGPGTFTPGVASGDTFLLGGSGEVLGLPGGYTGGLLAAEMNFPGTSLASLGLAPGEFVYALPSQDTLTVRVSPIPLPAGLSLLLVAFGLLLTVQRRARD